MDEHQYEDWETSDLERYGQVKYLDPFTNFPLLLSELKTTYWGTIDSILWSTVNLVVFSAFCWLVPFWMVLEFTLRIAYKKIQITSDVYDKYDKKLTKKFWRQLIKKLTQNTQDVPFDLDLAEFHAVLTSLAYEPVNVVDKVIDMWNRDIGLAYHRFGHEGCVITMVYSVQENFVVLAFKGTSVFNLTEWFTDATTRKIPAKNGVLPGLVHAGFYSALGFSTRSKAMPHIQDENTLVTITKKNDVDVINLDVGARPGEEDEEHDESEEISITPFRGDEESAGLSLDESGEIVAIPFKGEASCMVASTSVYLDDVTAVRINGVESRKVKHIDAPYEKYDGSGEGLMKAKLIYLKRKFGKQIPHLWITGHSLGAATATIFTSMLLWKRTKRGRTSGIYGGLNIDSGFKLHGTFTFGNPRVGDTDWKETMDMILKTTSDQYQPKDQPKYQFWRVVNSNDIVCSVPPTTLGSFLSRHDKSSRAPALTLNDFHHLGTSVTLGYHGSFKNMDEERNIHNVLRNLVKEWVSAPVYFWRGSLLDKTKAILNFSTFGMSGFLLDHDIGEYIKNLQILNEKNAQSHKS
ncbi:Alpha/Beta hydrolase protein [Jimgerdemannia flammicorona]|uniref:Alpha/Beta hydrolase protein n=1 Tax=Jimgerdemannia flammicorona TaxID=994334 RepID=A0A433QKY2_9FUNG|nr:Alpha/Beta hydrolase protein [Jimgerdemannia flammicorona]